MIDCPEIHCAHTDVINIEKVVPNPRNPNTHPEEQIELLAKIISAHGWRVPITVSRRSGYIVRGHGRLYAARLLNLDVVPVDYQDYESDAMEWADLLADNRIAELAETDDALLDELLEEIHKSDVDLELSAYSKEEVEKRIQAEDEEEEEEPPEIKFTEELMEAHNYIVLYFDNDVDWAQALTFFKLKSVKALGSKKGFEKIGIGRVIDGAKAMNAITDHLGIG